MRDITACFLERNRFTLFFLVCIAVLGVCSYSSLSRERTPDVRVPVISIVAVMDGMPVDQVEKLLAYPIEKEVKSIAGVKKIVSIVRNGIVSIALEFKYRSDMRIAIADVRARLDSVRSKLPRELMALTAEEINMGLFPIMKIAVVGDSMTHGLLEAARELKSKIELLGDIFKVKAFGMRDDIVELEFMPDLMNYYGIKIQDIQRALRGEYAFVGYGVLESDFGSHKVKIDGTLDSYEKVRDLVLRSGDNGFITLADVAKVKFATKDVSELARVNGKPCVILEVSKNSGSNIISVARQVREVMKDTSRSLQDEIRLSCLWDQSREVKEILHELENTVVFSVVLVLLVMMTFMGTRTAILTALAIPVSGLMAVIAIYLMGYTLNIVILFTMIMVLGMLVDDAIVITEYADRKMVYGMSKLEAYRAAVGTMFWSVTSSTAVRLVVFIPLLFWPGVIGEFIKYIPAVSISALVSSWIMAMVFTPVLGSIFGRKSTASVEEVEKINAIEDVNITKLGKVASYYVKVLQVVLDHPKKFVAAVTLTLLLSGLFYFTLGPGIEFFPDIDPDRAVIIVRSTDNLSMREKREIVQEIEKKIGGVKGIEYFYAQSENNSQNFEKDGVVAEIYIEFLDWRIRESSKRILTRVFSLLEDMSGIFLDVKYDNMKPNPGKPLEIIIRSTNLASLQDAGKILETAMRKSQGFVGVHADNFVSGMEWVLDIDRKRAHASGIDVTVVGQYLKMLTDGLLVGKYYPRYSSDEIDVVARFHKSYRSLSNIDSLLINTPYGTRKISSFVKKRVGPETKTVKRVDGMRALTISSHLSPGYLLTERVNYLKDLTKNKLGSDVIMEFIGDMESQEESKSFLLKAFIFVLLLMVLILVLELNNFYYVFVVMTGVFLSTMCVFFGFLVTHKVFGVVMGGVGIVVLAGVSVNNNILLIDAFRANLSSMNSIRDAVMKAALSRARPIFLTVITGVLGLLPMVLKISVDFISGRIFFNSPSSQLWFELSSTISVGLLFSSVVMLLFTPAVLMLKTKHHDT